MFVPYLGTQVTFRWSWPSERHSLERRHTMDLLKMVLFGFIGVGVVVAFMATMTKVLGIGISGIGYG